MEKALLKCIYDEVCLYFSTSCTRCPFWPVREELGAACCADVIEDYPKEVALALARFIAGDVATNTPAGQQTKNPETRREILQAAERCVCGGREQDYGGPEDSFALIAKLWEPIIRARCVSPDADVYMDAVTVALLMAELKIARAATNTGHMDSWVDLAGYAACGGEIAARERRTKMPKFEPRTCPQCKKRFLPTTGKEKFCGRRCYTEYLRAGGWKKCRTTDKSR